VFRVFKKNTVSRYPLFKDQQARKYIEAISTCQGSATDPKNLIQMSFAANRTLHILRLEGG